MIRERGSVLKFKGKSGIELRGYFSNSQRFSCDVCLFPSDKSVRIVHLGVARKDKEQQIKRTLHCLW